MATEPQATGLPVVWRIPLLALGLLSMLAGVGAGLLRLGWAVPLPHLHLRRCTGR